MFNYEMPSKQIGLRKCFCTKIFFFFNIFYSFNPNHAYWNQRRLFSGNLPGMFVCIINSRRQPLSGYYSGALLFLQFKEFELFWALSFFKIFSHIFMIVEVKLDWWFWSLRNRQWSEKASGFAEWILCSNFKVEWENCVWTKFRFLASGFLFTCGNFTLVFTVFLNFLDMIFIFFLNFAIHS